MRTPDIKVTLKKMKIAQLIYDKFESKSKFAESMGINNHALSVMFCQDQTTLRYACKIANGLDVPVQDIVNENLDS